MAQGSKSKYTSKQKRKAEHIEEGYEKRGLGKKEAERRAWATVNKSDKGGKKSGSGRGKKSRKASSRKGGRKSGGPSGTNLERGGGSAAMTRGGSRSVTKSESKRGSS